MSDPPSLWTRRPGRSMGLKFLLVCALALLMTIPALFVFALLADRTQRAEQVTEEVGRLIGGRQTVLGPVIAVPYQIPPRAQGGEPARGVYVIFPESARAQVSASSQVRRRSLFRVPVYQADVAFAAAFDLAGAPANAPEAAVLDWSRAEFLIGVSDPRGAQSDVTLTVAGEALQLAPAGTLAERTSPRVQPSPLPPSAAETLHFFGTGAARLVQPGARLHVEADLALAGAQRLALLPYGRTTVATVKSDWPHPSFDGGFLPSESRIDAQGFTASWQVPFVARGVPAEGGDETLAQLGSSSLGVSFVDPADPYQSVARSLKYALLFVGLVFLTFFTFETTTRRRVHPAQYVLIGLAQVVFYLLLLSVAEHVGFDWAFLVAAAATVSLISAYAGWVFESRWQGLVAFVAFAALYSLIYVLMRLEDLALLVGAVASFLAIAAVMYLTRKIDWYGATDPDAA